MWVAYALGASVATAVCVVLTKKGLETAKPSASLAIQAGLSLVVALAFVGLRGEYRAVGEFDRRTWWLVGGAGLLISAAAVLRVLALGAGPASAVASLDQLSLALTATLGVVLLGEAFNWRVGLGVVLMIGGALLVTLGRPPS